MRRLRSRSGQEVARIKDVGFGVRDTNHCYLYFTVELENSFGEALQMLIAEDAIKIIERNGISNIKHLEGKMCWVDTDGMSVMFNRLWDDKP